LSNPIKKEHQDVLDLSFDTSDARARSDVSRNAPVGTRQIQEDGKEVFLILDSDSEGEDFVALPSLRDREDGMSSDTAVNSDFGGIDSEDDDGPVVTVGNYSDSDIDPLSDLEPQSVTVWLDEGLISKVSNKPCKVTRQRSVERVEYLKDIPSYWPIPEDFVAYVLDLSDPKFEIRNKDGELLPVDALICDKASKIK
jgi:hypothetical protein